MGDALLVGRDERRPAFCIDIPQNMCGTHANLTFRMPKSEHKGPGYGGPELVFNFAFPKKPVDFIAPLSENLVRTSKSQNDLFHSFHLPAAAHAFGPRVPHGIFEEIFG